MKLTLFGRDVHSAFGTDVAELANMLSSYKHSRFRICCCYQNMYSALNISKEWVGPSIYRYADTNIFIRKTPYTWDPKRAIPQLEELLDHGNNMLLSECSDGHTYKYLSVTSIEERKDLELLIIKFI